MKPQDLYQTNNLLVKLSRKYYLWFRKMTMLVIAVSQLFPNFSFKYHNWVIFRSEKVRNWVSIDWCFFSCDTSVTVLSIILHSCWSLLAHSEARALRGRRDGWPMASLLLFNSMTGFLVLAAITDAKMLLENVLFGLSSRTSLLCFPVLLCTLTPHVFLGD